MSGVGGVAKQARTCNPCNPPPLSLSPSITLSHSLSLIPPPPPSLPPSLPSLSRSLARSLSRSLLLLLFLLLLPGEQDARRSPVTVRRVSPVSDEVAYALATGPGLVPSLTLGPHRCRHVPVSVASPPPPPCPVAPRLLMHGPKKSESRVHLRPPRFCAARLPGPCAAPAGCADETQRSRSGAACHTRHARAHIRTHTRARARQALASLTYGDLRKLQLFGHGSVCVRARADGNGEELRVCLCVCTHFLSAASVCMC